MFNIPNYVSAVCPSQNRSFTYPLPSHPVCPHCLGVDTLVEIMIFVVAVVFMFLCDFHSAMMQPVYKTQTKIRNPKIFINLARNTQWLNGIEYSMACVLNGLCTQYSMACVLPQIELQTRGGQSSMILYTCLTKHFQNNP